MYRGFHFLSRSFYPPIKPHHLGLKKLAKIGGPCAHGHSTPGQCAPNEADTHPTDAGTIAKWNWPTNIEAEKLLNWGQYKWIEVDTSEIRQTQTQVEANTFF